MGPTRQLLLSHHSSTLPVMASSSSSHLYIIPSKTSLSQLSQMYSRYQFVTHRIRGRENLFQTNNFYQMTSIAMENILLVDVYYNP